MLEFKEQLNETKETKKAKSFFLKGIIHMITDKEFEVFEEKFFYSGLEKNGYFLTNNDIDISLEYDLGKLDWGFIPEVDRCYCVLYEFEIINTVEFNPFDDKESKEYLEYIDSTN